MFSFRLLRASLIAATQPAQTVNKPHVHVNNNNPHNRLSAHPDSMKFSPQIEPKRHEARCSYVSSCARNGAVQRNGYGRGDLC
ncbi:hypothetical protein RB195_010783 [Necator americanus]|uniref:Secreted protein n=1 Tax=Necator americanus TaxID=51031 RepID=A0ABR1CZH9_NECAM